MPPRTDIPDVLVSSAQLRRNNGDRGAPKWVACDGVVYDVSECRRWRGAMHENLHFPGQDLSTELPDSPHGEIVFAHPCVRPVGRLQG